jgi:hypothetical protein
MHSPSPEFTGKAAKDPPVLIAFVYASNLYALACERGKTHLMAVATRLILIRE